MSFRPFHRIILLLAVALTAIGGNPWHMASSTLAAGCGFPSRRMSRWHLVKRQTGWSEVVTSIGTSWDHCGAWRLFRIFQDCHWFMLLVLNPHCTLDVLVYGVLAFCSSTHVTRTMSFIILLRRLSRKIHHSHNEPTSRRRLSLIPPTMHWSFTTYHWPISQSISDGKICQGKSFLAWSQWCFPWLPIWASLRLYTNLTSALVVISWGSHGFPDSHDSQYLTIKWDTFNQKL